jgi:hypothetical protein
MSTRRAGPTAGVNPQLTAADADAGFTLVEVLSALGLEGLVGAFAISFHVASCRRFVSRSTGRLLRRCGIEGVGHRF